MVVAPPPNTPVAPGSPVAAPPGPHHIIETGEGGPHASTSAGPSPGADFEPRCCKIAVKDLAYSVPSTSGAADVISGWFFGEGDHEAEDEGRRERSQSQSQSQRVTPMVIADISMGGGGGGGAQGSGAAVAESTVLCDVSFSAEPSQVVALLNCGTELDPSSASPRVPALVLRALAGRIDPARITGKIAVDKDILTPAISQDRMGQWSPTGPAVCMA